MTPEETEIAKLALRVGLVEAEVDLLANKLDGLALRREASEAATREIAEGSVVWSRASGEEFVAVAESTVELVEPQARGGARRAHRVRAWIVLGDNGTALVPTALLMTKPPEHPALRSASGVLTRLGVLLRAALRSA